MGQGFERGVIRHQPQAAGPPILICCERCRWRAEHRACANEELTQEAIAFLRKLLEIHEHESHKEVAQ
jgi:hypothetical protein